MAVDRWCPRTVLLAPDKFKGSLTAREVCTALAEGLLSGHRPPNVVARPVADGGEGTLDAALAAGYHAVPIAVVGPTGQPRRASLAVKAGTVIVELAETCGLQHLPSGRPAPLDSTSQGLGMAISAALDLNPNRIVIGLGGSASTDGGLGALVALGAMAKTANGGPVRPGGAGLSDLHDIDLRGIDPRLQEVELVLATDVTSVLFGPTGAAHMFAPQKGADAAVVGRLDEGLRRLDRVVQRCTGRRVSNIPGAGAAGGVPVALMAASDARVVSGASFVLDLLEFDDALSRCDLVVTGEGTWDAQTATGKAPNAVLNRASGRAVPVMAVAGRFDSAAEPGQDAGVTRRFSLIELATREQDPMRNAAAILRQIGAIIAEDLNSLAHQKERNDKTRDIHR